MPEIERSIEMLSALVDSLPADARPADRFVAHFVLARCCAESYDTLKAVKHFRAAVSLDPGDLDAQMGLLAEYSILVHTPAEKLEEGTREEWEGAFVKQLAVVQDSIVDGTTPGLLKVIFDEKRAGENRNLSDEDVERGRRFGFGVMRWKNR